MPRLRVPTLVCGLITVFATLDWTPVRAQSTASQRAANTPSDFKLSAAEQPGVLKGLQYLRSRTSQKQIGEAALMAMAMVNADVPANDPALSALLGRIRSRFAATAYSPERSGGQDIYEAAVVGMALADLDSVGYKAEVESVAQYLIGRQNSNGSWDYKGRDKGDSSISQYALLGLWAAEEAGVTIPPTVWDQAAGWYMSSQSSAGSWNYHRDESQYPETLSMTAAGVGSLLLCKRQLARYRSASDTPNPLLQPLATEGNSRQKYKANHSAQAIQESANKGIAWMGSHFALGSSEIVGKTPYYFLYAIERIAALSGDRQTLGGVNWYEQGRRFVMGSQKSDGSWNGDYGEEVNTAYAILFMTRATSRKVRKIQIKRLGAGTLLGGRGLPKDLSSLTVAQGHVMVRPMNGAVEGMLAVLEDPRAENADAALAGLIGRYQTSGSSILRPQKDRFRKLLNDPDPGVRRVAAWALGRIGDLDIVPLLVQTLKHPKEDDSVVAEAERALQFLSRKIDGFGPPIPSTPEQREQAAKRWLAWYNSVKPIDQETQDDTATAPATPASASAPAGESSATARKAP